VGWDNIGDTLSGLKEMGPGSCHDAIDDLLDDRNWEKVVGMSKNLSHPLICCVITDFTGDTLLRKLKAAVVESQTQAAAHARYEQVLPTVLVNEWRDKVEQWEKDKRAPNPFAIVSKGKLSALIRNQKLIDILGPTEVAIRLELYAGETEVIARGDLQMMHDEVTPCVFIMSGLELEDQQ
jgi:hypothetical protein